MRKTDKDKGRKQYKTVRMRNMTIGNEKGGRISCQMYIDRHSKARRLRKLPPRGSSVTESLMIKKQDWREEVSVNALLSEYRLLVWDLSPRVMYCSPSFCLILMRCVAAFDEQGWCWWCHIRLDRLVIRFSLSSWGTFQCCLLLWVFREEACRRRKCVISRLTNIEAHVRVCVLVEVGKICSSTVRCRTCFGIALGRKCVKSHLPANWNWYRISAATTIIIVVATRFDANPTSAHPVIPAALAANPESWCGSLRHSDEVRRQTTEINVDQESNMLGFQDQEIRKELAIGDDEDIQQKCLKKRPNTY